MNHTSTRRSPEETSAVGNKNMRIMKKNGESSAIKQEENIQIVSDKNRKSDEKNSGNIVEQVACFKCKFCMFLSLSEEAVAIHVQHKHSSAPLTNENTNTSMRCPGCTNVFFSEHSLKVHLAEDHRVAQKELENILSAFKRKNVTSKENFQNKPTATDGSESQDDVRKASAFGVIEVQRGKIIPSGSAQAVKAESVMEKSSQKAQKSSVIQRLIPDDSVKLSLSDEPGKIRVRKMSSLEKAQEENNTECMETDSQEAELGMSSSVITSFSEEHTSAPAELHLIDCDPSDVGHDRNLNMGIQYDLDSMQILDIPLGQESNVPQEQIILEQIEQNIDGTVQSVIIDDEGNHCIVSRCQTPHRGILGDIAEEEVLDSVLYVEDDDNSGGSPILLCFAESPDMSVGNEDIVVQENESFITHSVHEKNGNSSNERIILSSCALDGSSFVGTDGKRLVKRGFVRRPPVKKDKVRKPKIMKSKSSSAKRSDDPTISGYKCNIYGCTVRLLSHDNMEYHQRCHSSDVPESALKVTTSCKNEAQISKRGRVLNSKQVFVCPECSMETHSWKQTKLHLWKAHSIDMELYSCDHCGYKTPSLSNMNNIHAKIHGSEKPFLCDTCGKGFKTTKQLRNHKRIHITKDTTIETCEICKRTFHTNRMLRNHINTVHNKVRPYMCSECGHTAANRSSLKMHLRQHTGDRPYQCNECEYKTSDHNSLRRHKKRHTGDKPYKCPHCPYACIQSSTFKVHLRSKHPGEDSGLMFSCKKCSFHTISRDIYLAHVGEHGLSEACGIPFKGVSRPSQKRTAKTAKSNEPQDEIPIFVSIATGDVDEHAESSNFEDVVHHVSEEILPGSNLHVLYNSISLSESPSKTSLGGKNSSSAIFQDSECEIVDDESELQLDAEVENKKSIEKIRHSP